jgi:glyoxylase-like metal-dependent hydrolase (beta-lactamase superfamily II)
LELPAGWFWLTYEVVTTRAFPLGTPDWTEPGLFTVAPGVHRIPLPLPTDGLRAVNVYVIEDGDGLVLVDSGWALDVARRQLEAALTALDAGLPDVRRFLVTHLHRDHYTQAVAIRRELGTPVALGAEERLSLDRIGTQDTPLSAQLDRLALAGARTVLDRLLAMLPPAGSRSRSAEYEEYPDDWIADGAAYELTGRTLTAVHTPGHTRGHVVFVDAGAGLLFAGDHVLPHITPSIGFEPAPPELALRDYLGSLAAVRRMPDLRLLPAHGPVGESAHSRIDQLLEHHRTRLEECAEAVRQGAGTAYQAAGLLAWTRRLRPLDELDTFNQMLAVIETAEHLNLLVVQGRLRSGDIDGVRHYEAT